MTDRHSKWVRVEPGTVIPAGQPYRVEFGGGLNAEYPNAREAQTVPNDESDWFVDSWWKPPHPCNAPLNIKGEGFNCDRGWGHARPHGNREAGAIWDDEQPPDDSSEPTPNPEPPLVLPTEPTWGIAVGYYGGLIADQWAETNRLGYPQLACSQDTWLAGDVVDFIPLTDEQVARIKAAR